MKKLVISSSSFIFSEHPAWDSLSSKFILNFKYVGNFANSFLLKDKNEILVSILFTTDLFDENISSYLDNKKIQEICEPIINLIVKKIKYSKRPIIIAMSAKSTYNIISSVFQIPAAQKIFNYISQRINLLQKKYNNIYFINLDYKFSHHGYDRIFDKRNWYLANSKISIEGLELIVEDVKKVIDRIYSPAKKLLVLDCDNTLWGGILGEDGIKSISLGQDGIGKAFVDFQKTIKSFLNQGVLLAIASKNNEKDVLEVFEKHESMEIKKKDIINFKVNWKEKSENIRAISEELDLGLESFVFWDDNPFERDKVKKNLPQVLTVDPTDEVVYWADQLRQLDELSKFNVTAEDKIKLKQYKIRSKFLTGKKNFSDEGNYLKSIKLNATRIKINQSNISRAVQMTQKTNQFNLRTARYTQSEIERINKNKKNIAFLVNLKDIYGEHGITAILIAKNIDNKSIFIDTCLMSCRILGRNLESWILKELQKVAQKRGIEHVYAEYIETKSNSMCKSFYSDHNFKKIKATKEVQKKIKIKGALYYSKISNMNVKLSNVYD
tara:strand:+ start:58 stop:1716 length:1659 start_codon:yes stop_codon:yes gene_type:complete